MRKKGQIQISFGMIFSIIIIIATVAIGFYVINYFLDLASCSKIGVFWDSLNKDIDKAWVSDMSQTVFKGELPSGISKICFGNFTMNYAREDIEQFEFLKRYESRGRNAYLYPPGKACDLGFFELKHIEVDEFFCVPVRSGSASIKLTKTTFDPLVRLTTP